MGRERSKPPTYREMARLLAYLGRGLKILGPLLPARSRVYRRAKSTAKQQSAAVAADGRSVTYHGILVFHALIARLPVRDGEHSKSARSVKLGAEGSPIAYEPAGDRPVTAVVTLFHPRQRSR
jgi:hypothetical protein